MYFYDESSQIRGSSGQVAFYADTEADIAELPTHDTEGVKQGEDDTLIEKVGFGSSCLVIDTGTLYILNSNNEWKSL